MKKSIREFNIGDQVTFIGGTDKWSVVQIYPYTDSLKLENRADVLIYINCSKVIPEPTKGELIYELIRHFYDIAPDDMRRQDVIKNIDGILKAQK